MRKIIMKVNMYAIHDSKAGAYGQPFLLQTNGLASRSFIQAVMKQDSPFNKDPLDYTLFRIGNYDDETSIIKSETPPEMLITAMQAIIISDKENQKIIETTKQINQEKEDEVNNQESE